MKVVIDTNVLVSALLFPEGPPGLVLKAVLTGQMTLLLEDRIYAEYTDVLRRPKFALPAARVSEVLTGLATSAEWVVPGPSALALPDPDDSMFVACALSGRADCIVTGNSRHFPAQACAGVQVLSPAEFLRLLSAAP